MQSLTENGKYLLTFYVWPEKGPDTKHLHIETLAVQKLIPTPWCIFGFVCAYRVRKLNKSKRKPADAVLSNLSQ